MKNAEGTSTSERQPSSLVDWLSLWSGARVNDTANAGVALHCQSVSWPVWPSIVWVHLPIFRRSWNIIAENATIDRALQAREWEPNMKKSKGVGKGSFLGKERVLDIEKREKADIFVLFSPLLPRSSFLPFYFWYHFFYSVIPLCIIHFFPWIFFFISSCYYSFSPSHDLSFFLFVMARFNIWLISFSFRSSPSLIHFHFFLRLVYSLFITWMISLFL